MLHTFGHEVVAAGLAGGTAGELIRAELARCGVPTQFTPIALESRRVIEVTDASTGETTSFTEPSPYITTEELGRLAADYRDLLEGASAAVLCGGLPDGLPPETYATFATYAAEAGVPVVLDAGAAALWPAAARHPALVIPEPGGAEPSGGAAGLAGSGGAGSGVAGSGVAGSGVGGSRVAASGLAGSGVAGAGVAATGAAVRDQLIASAGRYWVHLDVDVLDELAFPATDYLMPGGLSRDEVADLMRPLLASPALAGLSLACYNPAKDADGDGARYLVGLFRELL